MLIRDRNWMGLQPSVDEYIKSAYKDEAVITPRSWYMAPVRADKAFIDFVNMGNGQRSFASGVLGLVPNEAKTTGIDSLIVAGRWLQEGDHDVAILPVRMASLVGITPADVGKVTLDMLGRKWTVIGLIDEQRMLKLADLDDEILTPVDLRRRAAATDRGGARGPDADRGRAPIQTFTHISPENIMIIPHEGRHGPRRYAPVARGEQLHPAGQHDRETSRRSCPASPSRTFVGHEGKVNVYSSLGATSLSGLANLGVPIAVAALIVLNTMLGAVYDRKREIAIFATIGLTPSHIAALFIAEADRLRGHRRPSGAT